jgi:hypothetical protein
MYTVKKTSKFHVFKNLVAFQLIYFPRSVIYICFIFEQKLEEQKLVGHKYFN